MSESHSLLVGVQILQAPFK